ncbi:hypothetical protein ACM61V_05315 [Sphingomonas sp. TX0543]
MRLLAPFVIFLLSMGATTPASSTVAGDFCARLAANSGISQAATGGEPTSWTVSALNFGQRFLVGGTAATGVGVLPVEPSTVEDYRRLEDMCLPEKKGAICKLVGPVIFKFIWKGRKIITPVETGERATVSVAGIKATCRSEPKQ